MEFPLPVRHFYRGVIRVLHPLLGRETVWDTFEIGREDDIGVEMDKSADIWNVCRHLERNEVGEATTGADSTSVPWGSSSPTEQEKPGRIKQISGSGLRQTLAVDVSAGAVAAGATKGSE